MSEREHTPGPWFINRESEDVIEGKLSIESVNAETQPSYFIAQVDECKSQEANARLIAAAPELLEFAEEWLCMQGSDENYMTAKARAAIAKATGESK